MRKGCKKGQFYLITVVILISLFIAFASTYNFLGREKGMNIYEIKKEIEIESQKTMEYIAYQKLSNTESRNILSNFSSIYIKRLEKNKNSFFIYGTYSDLFIKGFKASEDEINLSINNGEYEKLDLNIGEEFGPLDYHNVNNLKIKVGEVEILFEIKEGQSLYYLIHYREVGGEYIVVHN
jgi:hypothetical protein